jgi:hypothetical protein
MKPSLSSLARALSVVAAIATSAALVCIPAAEAHAGGGGGGGGGGGHGGGGGWHGGGGGWHGGGHYHGGYWGYGGYYWPGAFWGGVAVGYYGGYYGPYYGGYYAPYYPAYYYDQAPAYGSAEQGAPRTGQPVPQAPAPAEPIFYPRNGQSADVTESDRRECNRWATTQNGAMNDASIFQRATFACMEGRGYTAK